MKFNVMLYGDATKVVKKNLTETEAYSLRDKLQKEALDANFTLTQKRYGIRLRGIKK